MFRVDTHFHVFDLARFALPPGPGYKPRADEAGTFEEIRALHEASGITHGVVVQPSGYGFDNSCTLDAVARSGGRYKAIAVVPHDVGEEQLAALRDRGVVGVRFNLVQRPDDAPRGGEGGRLLAALGRLGMIAQVFAPAARWPSLLSRFSATGVRVVADHLGHPDAAAGTRDPGWRALIDAARGGTAWIKLSGSYRLSAGGPEHDELAPFVDAILQEVGPQRCVWGSDWPFIGVAERPTLPRELEQLERYVPDERARRVILWDSPAALYGLAGST